MTTDIPVRLHAELQARLVNHAALRVREHMRARLANGLFMQGDSLELRYAVKFENATDPSFKYLTVDEIDPTTY